MSPSMKIHVCWVNLLKNQIIQNFLKKGYKAKDSFFLPFGKKKCSMGSIFLALGVG
jgi:hypothetical protein